MSEFLVYILVPIAVAAVAIVLLLGLINLARGGSPHRSQKLMRLRVLLQFVAMLWLLWADGAWAFYIFAVVFGLGYGGGVTLIATITGEYFGLRSYGTIFGVMLLISGLGGALGPVLAGYVFDMTGSYVVACIVAAGAVLSAFVMVLFLRAPLIEGADS